MERELEAWFARRTWQSPVLGAEELSALKRGRRVSVVLPALNEEATVGAIVAELVPLTCGPAPLVDEVVVVDSGSSDRTMAVAAAAGARVVECAAVLPEVAVRPGKGEVLWRSLAVTSGDVVVFLDSDLVEFDAGFVPALLEPLLTADGVCFVKGFYRRPLRVRDGESDTGGGRVTELLVRPLLAALCPRLCGVIQPLGGEYAATRELLESVPFAPGCGVEIGLLMDTEAGRGLDALAQVNLGVRKHRNRTLLELGVMSRQIVSAMFTRARCPDIGGAITQFHQAGDDWVPVSHDVEVRDRAPMGELLTGAIDGPFC